MRREYNSSDSFTMEQNHLSMSALKDLDCLIENFSGEEFSVPDVIEVCTPKSLEYLHKLGVIAENEGIFWINENHPFVVQKFIDYKDITNYD